ncbi:amino acid ABC transporter permease [Enemella evansiae]|uniref:Amino acid ABC transporter permease n=1 Tax=Enemella evansiae TaxID=2016499 RepID=A0A255FVY2_9ACTN|nr:amino acid ABC transporter permease [Enemella evansiae]OYO07849.1 amino acid ABC transporter permease [Enemella evansiae]
MSISTRSRPVDETPEAPRAAGEQPSVSAALDPAALRIVPRRRPLTWVATVVVALLLVGLVRALVTNPAWEWGTFADYFLSVSILKALLTTLQLTALGTVIGFALGVVLAAMRLSESLLLQAVAYTFVWAFRSIPLMVQLIFWFNFGYLYRQLSVGIPFGPELFSIDTNALLSAMAAAVLGLALHQAAYAAEIVRAGILSVDAGQVEAAEALGIPRWRRFRRIVMPQAMRSILPNAVNEVISLFKGTSIVSVMAIPELFYQVQVIYGRNSRVIPLLMVATVWYIILTTLLSIAQYFIERHFGRGSERTPRATPVQRLRAALGQQVQRGRTTRVTGGADR